MFADSRSIVNSAAWQKSNLVFESYCTLNNNSTFPALLPLFQESSRNDCEYVETRKKTELLAKLCMMILICHQTDSHHLVKKGCMIGVAVCHNGFLIH